MVNVALEKSYNNKISNNATFIVQYRDNIDDLGRAAVKVMNARANDAKVYDNQLESMNNVLETLNIKNKLNINKDEQIAKIDNYVVNAKNKCDEYSQYMKTRCIDLDEAVYQMALSLHSNNSSTIKREDYNYSLNYYDRYLIIQEYPELLNVLQSAKNIGNLNADQSRKYANLSNLIEKFEKEAEENNNYIQDIKTPLENQLEKASIYLYDPTTALETMYTELIDNYVDFSNRYDNEIKTLKQFDENFENIQTTTEKITTNKYAELLRYRETLKQIKEGLKYIQNSTDNKQNTEKTKEILALLTNAQRANNQATYKLEIDELEALVTAVDIKPETVVDEEPSTIEELSATDEPDTTNEQNTSDGNGIKVEPEGTDIKSTDSENVISNKKPVKVYRDGKVIIQYEDKEVSLDGRLIHK